jgi:hypothetical protein
VLIRLESVAVFEQMAALLRERGPVHGREAADGAEPAVPVPRGPVERW